MRHVPARRSQLPSNLAPKASYPWLSTATVACMCESSSGLALVMDKTRPRGATRQSIHTLTSPLTSSIASHRLLNLTWLHPDTHQHNIIHSTFFYKQLPNLTLCKYTSWRGTYPGESMLHAMPRSGGESPKSISICRNGMLRWFTKHDIVYMA